MNAPPGRSGYTRTNDLIERSGAFLIVIIALGLATVVACVAIGAIALGANAVQVAAVASSSVTAIGTIAGLYSGVRLGADNERRRAGGGGQPPTSEEGD